jgi:hypothetical protein
MELIDDVRYKIEDCRIDKYFSKISFSGYKNTEVKKQLLNEILKGRIEHSNYWVAELICAGHYLDIWETILFALSKYIHCGNPKLAIYLEMRYNDFKKIILSNVEYIENELEMRNDIRIRKLFSEMISILCFSQKKSPISEIKIESNEFHMTEINYRLSADGLHYVNDIFMRNDPKELFIACNELAYNITKQNINNNTQNAYYWYSWIIEFENKCKKLNKETYVCEPREEVPVPDKYKNNIIWIVWDIILNETRKRDKMTHKIITSLYHLYCIRFSPGVKKRRKYIIYYALLLLTDEVNYNVQILTKKEELNTIHTKLNYIYKEIKANETRLEEVDDTTITSTVTTTTTSKSKSTSTSKTISKNSKKLQNTIMKLDKMKEADFMRL